MVASSAAVSVQGLIKRYRRAEVNAVDGISFEVGDGDFFALLGPNGAGKTTTISILTTTLAPTAGEVRIAGHDLRRDPEAVRRSAGIIFQNPSLDMNLSGEENVRLHAIMCGLFPFRPSFGMMPRAYRDQVGALAAVLGMEADMRRPVKTLSGGMQRKLEIIRGLMHRPRVLFLDEPTSGLDAASRRSLWAYLQGVRSNDGTTIFLTTHNLEEAEEADRICILNHGRIVALGTPEQVKSQLLEEWLILDAADRSTLRSELKKLKLRYVEKEHFEVGLAGTAAHHILGALSTPLTLVRTRSPSLVDAYLRIVADE